MQNRYRRWTLAISLASPVIAIFLLPSSFALALQRPAVIAATALKLPGVVGSLFALAFYWVCVAIPVAIVMLVMCGKRWTPKLCVIVVVMASCAIITVKGRAETDVVYEGTFEFGFEYSAFYPAGQCWRPPYWLIPTPELHGKMNSLGPTVRVRFVGNATPIGNHGHLGAYLREVRVKQVLEVQPAQPCRN